MHTLLNSQYRVKTIIGSGGFGTVFRGEDVTTSNDVAIKIQPTPNGTLLHECAVYKQITGATGFPRLRDSGCENGRHFIVLDLLGNSIRQLFRDNGRQFSLKTILMVIDQMLTRVEYLHLKGFLHGDLKPSNFLIGLNSQSNVIYLIDFGLATPIPTLETVGLRGFSGTPCYASIRVQSGREACRRDDLESLGYIFIYLATGSLPWRHLAVEQSSAFAAILETKSQLPIEELCRGLPPAFGRYLAAVRGLGFVERPDYSGYRRLFRELFDERGFVYNYRYDWVMMRQKLPFSFGIRSARSDLGAKKSLSLLHGEHKGLKKQLHRPV
jgi:serine/threonine protein kinase